MNDDVTQLFVSRLRAAGVRGVPCNERDVSEVERQLRVQFPAAYKAFLLLAGGGWEPLEGSHYAIEDDLARLQRAGRRIAAHGKADLPRDAFVFFVHQGFACYFFLLQDGDDPAVYHCVDGMGPIQRISNRFSEWVLGKLSG